MSTKHMNGLERVLREGEPLGLLLGTLLLITIEVALVYWLNHIPLPSQQPEYPAYLVLPPWYQRPRFEVTLLLTIAAGILFSVCRGLLGSWHHRNGGTAPVRIRHLSRRLNTAASLTAIAGFELALATWLAR